MRKPDTPFARITRTSRWLNFALFGILPFALILIGALYWGLNRIVDQERDRLKLDFSILVGYVQAQEQFLGRLRAHNASLPEESLSTTINLHATEVPERFGMQIFEGQHTYAEMAFSLACEQATDCPTAGRRLANLGEFLADFYSSFWAASYYPASTVFLVNQADSISMSVPAVDAVSGYDRLNAAAFLAVTDAVRTELRRLQTVRQRLIDQDLPSHRELPGTGRVHWFRSEALPGSMLGIIYADMPQSVWSTAQGRTSAVYATTQFNHQRINIFEKTLRKPLHGGFWLTHRDEGLLLGEAPGPAASRDGLEYTADGIVLRVTDPSGVWTGTYRISYGAFFQDNLWLPAIAGLLLLLSLGAGIVSSRWYSRHVIAPASNAQRDIVEKEEFSRTLIETAPVALCVLARPMGQVVFGNSLALQWLGAEPGRELDNSPKTNLFLRQVLGATGPGTIASFEATDGRPLYVAYAPTRYNNQDVVLCAFSDISARAVIEQALTDAKREADKANEAKSTFLATMSHEIRTPLYGVLGTLQLMSLTALDEEQRQHLERMQSSSAILLQLISDVLDITKIEAGQLALEYSDFNPRELVEECTNAYAAMAEQKGLLLFCSVDVDVPDWMTGDPVRIRQILSNLLSNAIKFSDSGHVIVRLTVGHVLDGKTHLRLQVVDTGIGIPKEGQAQLFVPFYQIDSGSHTVRGAGIGLSICARLAGLMGTSIRVTSELGLGSSFSLDLPLSVAAGQAASPPDLSGMNAYVRSPHHELSDNVCQWLKRWGAAAAPVSAPLPAGTPDDILVDVLYTGGANLAAWPGHHVLASASGKPPTARTVKVIASVEHIAAAMLAAVRGEVALSGDADSGAYTPLGLSILVAEDNPINQATLQHQLEQLGCEVTLASDGAEALMLWGLARYDVVLTDVNMPRMNGYELVQALRAQGATVPVIGVTANAMREEEERCLAAGMTSWLVKPISLSTLRRHLQGSGAQPADAAEAAAQPRATRQPEPEPAVPEKYRALFISTMEADVTQMVRALEINDQRLLGRTLHRMRGALSVMQMTAITERLEALEDLLRGTGLDAVAQAEGHAVVQLLRNTLAEI
ncbi:Sensor histidine kinase RcsC [Achromobacter mucicolens]|uniref:hybrid sensor histidine kinase/response regulator n=1 Tax=Achromobacter mucicolens TaxID=1389922 RepID=UPI001469090B|nr:hybrid sensor histidine kinase/response regulator [Achromobacter mucicolens]CAB3830867.1 Sensor histidine kinase RcsC [Achromobacter mucicolens]